MPLPSPEQVLLRTSEHLHSLSEITVASDATMVLPVGPNQVGEDLRVTAVGLRTRGGMPVTVSADGEWVDRVHRVSGGHHALHEQAAIGLDADDDRLRAVSMSGNELVDTSQSFDPLRNPCASQALTGLVEQAEIVMILGPIDAQIAHCFPP
jgi:hypothetical protein